MCTTDANSSMLLNMDSVWSTSIGLLVPKKLKPAAATDFSKAKPVKK
jgi:hypothetical protein